MTEEQTYQLLEKIFTEPESLTPGELQAIEGSERLKELYNTSWQLKQALIKPSAEDPNAIGPQGREIIDLDKEWNLLSAKIESREHSWIRRLLAVAAIFLGVVCAGLVAIHLLSPSQESSAPYPLEAIQEVAPLVDDGVEDVHAQVLVPAPEAIKSVPTPAKEEAPKSTPRRASKATKPDMVEVLSQARQAEEALDMDFLARNQQAREDNILALQEAEMIAIEHLCNPDEIPASMLASLTIP
ncbi:MAG: hypothetical protein LIO90_01155 [Bacteroidales bacterium]|nr:hypothetical protein [Bacteroidales bacterium]